MKIIEPSYEVLRRKILTPLQKIESAARTAYKSEDKITNYSSESFCNRLLEKKHYPVFEFANLHFKFRGFNNYEDAHNIEYHKVTLEFSMICRSFPHLHVSEAWEITQDVGMQKAIYISGTVRAFAEAFGTRLDVTAAYSTNLIWAAFANFYQQYAETKGLPLGMPRKLDYPFSWKEKVSFRSVKPYEFFHVFEGDTAEQNKHFMVPVKFICSRAVSHELVRHRPCSFIQQSQRYCNYSGERFGKEITFIKPSAFFPDNSPEYKIWEDSMQQAEEAYMRMIEDGCTAQAARNVLPNSCATEIIVYATLAEWEHIMRLRAHSAADPAMQQLMLPLNKKLFFMLDCFE